MPVEMAVWRLGDEGPERMHPTRIDSERALEDAITADLSLIDDGLLLLGRQVPTKSGKYVDLLAIDEEGTVHVVELKRDRTPREVVAQVLDYGSWVQTLGHEDVRGIFRDNHPDQEFEAAFGETFGTAPPEELNEKHRLIIVASRLDPATERIIGYLGETHGVPINAVFFRHFEDRGSRFLMRSWFIDPDRAEARAESKSTSRREPWNGRDFYVAFGHGTHRHWEDARRYGFVSAGGGAWYSRSLRHLEPGHRIFVHVPSHGYVGVGLVTEPAVPAAEFTVEHDGRTLPYADAPLQAPDPHEHIDDPKKSEYLVRVDWLATVPIDQAHWEKGLFANQNSACKLRSRFTIERVSARFGVGE